MIPDLETPSKISSQGGIRRHWLSLKEPLMLFLVNRLGLFLLVYLSLALIPPDLAPGQCRAYPGNMLLDGWFRWDSGWYAGIAQNGYTNVPKAHGQRDTAFFPLYPLAAGAAGGPLGSPFLGGFLVSNLCALIASLLLYKLVEARWDAGTARRALTLLLVFPFSFYLSSMHSEALFLAAALGAFYCADKKMWLAASLCAAAASATRIVGVVTSLGLLLVYFQQAGYDPRRIRGNILFLAIAPLGLAAHMAYLGMAFGDPLQFVHSQLGGWVDEYVLTKPLAMITQPSLPLLANVLSGKFPVMNAVNMGVFLGALVLLVCMWRKIPFAYAVWTLLILMISFGDWRGVMGRAAAVLFPLFIAAAIALSRKERLYQAAVYGCALLLALFAVAFSHGYWVAG